MNGTKQLAIGERAPATWESLSYAGGDPSGRMVTFFAPHPATGRNVTLTHDRTSGATTSTPPCPELESLARFATMVRDTGNALRNCRFTDRQLAGLVETAELLVRARPDDERERADLEALRIEIKRRGSLGAIAQAQAEGRSVRRLVADELFGDGC